MKTKFKSYRPMTLHFDCQMPVQHDWIRFRLCQIPDDVDASW